MNTPETEIERCRQEQQFIQSMPGVQEGTKPAWLVTLGMLDWEIEIEMIINEGR